MIPSNKRFVIIRFRQIKAAKIQASLGNISYNENLGLSPMLRSNGEDGYANGMAASWNSYSFWQRYATIRQR